MKQVKEAIYNALINSADLTAITEDITPGWPDETATYPNIRFNQTTGSTILIDGKMKLNDEIYSIDIFATTMTETEDITLIIDDLMNNLSFPVNRELNVDQFEQDTKIYHKILRYRVKSI